MVTPTPNHRRPTPVAALIALGLMIAMPAGAIPRGASAAAPIGETEGDAMSAYDFTLPAIDGGTIDLGAWTGRPILVVNTASLCGFTPQYEGLVSLWQRYRDQGLMVVGVPSGDFGGQEYDDAARTRDFCTITYGVDFPLASKQVVRGDAAHPLFRWLVASLGQDAQPRWNFHKYLIDGEGRAVANWPSRVEPTAPEVVAAIEATLR